MRAFFIAFGMLNVLVGAGHLKKDEMGWYALTSVLASACAAGAVMV